MDPNIREQVAIRVNIARKTMALNPLTPQEGVVKQNDVSMIIVTGVVGAAVLNLVGLPLALVGAAAAVFRPF